MSFILDALRKSESERQTETVSHVARAPLAVYRDRVPAWAYVVIAGLGVAVVTLGAVWWMNQRVESGLEAGLDSETALRAASTAPRAQVEPAATAAPVTSNATDTAATGPVGAVVPAESSGPVPDIGALLSQGVGIPELTLDMHVFNSDDPARRVVRINGALYREGDTMPIGPRIVEITPDGVVLSHSGRRFLLRRPGA